MMGLAGGLGVIGGILLLCLWLDCLSKDGDDFPDANTDPNR